MEGGSRKAGMVVQSLSVPVRTLKLVEMRMRKTLKVAGVLLVGHRLALSRLLVDLGRGRCDRHRESLE